MYPCGVTPALRAGDNLTGYNVRFRSQPGFAALLLALAACGPFRHAPRPEPATLIFRNDSFSQATVYVVAEGADFRRVGVVFGGKTDTLTVPPEYIRGAVNIVARLLARSDLPQTGSVSVLPGEWYEVTLTSDARLLTFLPARE